MVLSNCSISLIYTETSFHLLVRVNRLCSFEENITSLQSILTDFYHIPDAPRPKSDLPMHDLIWKVGAAMNDQDPIATNYSLITLPHLFKICNSAYIYTYTHIYIYMYICMYV